MAVPSAESLMRAAEHESGFSDWGWFDIRTPLQVLVDSVNTEANLTAHGEQACRERLGFVLANRLRMIEDRKRWPEIANERIGAPIIIPALPRSGTTALLQLLSQDPANRSPLTWEILAPSPPPDAATFEADPRVAQAQAMLEAHGFTRPDLMAMHPFGANVAEECIFICEHTMTLTGYGAFWDAPAYGAYCAQADDRPVFQVHKEVLQQLQFRRPADRWVLKAPTHMLHLPAIHATYPDAVYVQTHRDLGRIIPSLAKLFAALRRTFSDDPAKSDMQAAARGQLLAWKMALEAMIEFRQRPGMNARFVDVDYSALLAAPMAEVERIYDRLGLDLTPVARSRMEAWLAQNKPGRYGAHDYSLAECGLTEQDIDDSFGDYMDRYAVTRERRT